ncbi:hypothetical protein [Nocardioides taihuensis]|uniref:Uncharacterized protein n=1 Tax=Nocardioides taihuensis TaxID=1835606 RepID=A0ABW0BKG3_9ACTN
MAATIFTEEESGTTTGRLHPHNGYYGGTLAALGRDREDGRRPTRNVGPGPISPR